jgi:peptidoglycan/LPS O-acetylase OafA/YrhL
MIGIKENSLTRPATIPSLFFLRGIAALAVCLYHFMGNGMDGFKWVESIFGYGYLGLDLFFIISGFVIPYSMYQGAYSWGRFPKFLLKRSVRIEPPYIMSFLLIVLMRIVHIAIHNWQFYGDTWEYKHDWNQFWLHFVYLNQYFGYDPYSVVYWTLAIEIQFYLLIGLLFPLVISRKKIISVPVFTASCMLCWFLNLHFNWFIFQYGFFFITGVVVFLHVIKHISLRTFALLFTGLLVLIYFKNGPAEMVTAVLGGTGIIGVRRRWKVSDFFGKISYSFYLTHVEAGSWFMLYTQDIIDSKAGSRVIAVFFTIAFATAFYYLFERPAFRLSKKIKYRKKPLATPSSGFAGQP